MYSKTTKGITVTVTPYFLDDQSSPQVSHYVWAYQVNIKNLSASTMKLNHEVDYGQWENYECTSRSVVENFQH